MNQPGNQQFPGQQPGQGLTVIQDGPPGQGQPQVVPQPQYVAASPPGVAVQLPGSTHGLPTTPGYPSANTPVAQPFPQHPGQPFPQPVGQQVTQPPLPATVPMRRQVPTSLQPTPASPQQVPADLQQALSSPQQAPASPPRRGPNDDQLLAGAGRTVYEFTGAHSEEARARGKHQTFFGDTGDLGSVQLREERHSNLSRSGGPTMVVGGIAVAVIGALLTFFLMGDHDEETEQPATPEVAAAPEPAPAPAPAVDPAAVPPPEGAPVPPAVDPAAPVDPAAGGGAAGGGAAADTPPAEEQKPAEEPPPAEPAKKKSTSTKKKSTPAPEPEPEPEPPPKKKRTISPITPSKPPRDGLDNLPAPD
jgi:hypothetical protein